KESIQNLLRIDWSDFAITRPVAASYRARNVNGCGKLEVAVRYYFCSHSKSARNDFKPRKMARLSCPSDSIEQPHSTQRFARAASLGKIDHGTPFALLALATRSIDLTTSG